MLIDKLDDWSALTPEQKKRRLFEQQKATLDAFLERRAISKAEYDKNLHDMTVKMGYADSDNA